MVNTRLKPINIDELDTLPLDFPKIIYYKVGLYDCSDEFGYWSCDETFFYKTNDVFKEVKTLKFVNWIPKLVTIQKPNNEFLFKVNINIESIDLTKKQVRKSIIKGFRKYLKKLNRETEIKNGDII